MRKKSAALLTAGILSGCQGLSQVSEPDGKRDHPYSKAFEACLDRPLEGRYTAAQLEGICAREELDRLKRDIAHDWKTIEADIRKELAQSKRVELNRHRLDGLQKMKKLYQEMMTSGSLCRSLWGSDGIKSLPFPLLRRFDRRSLSLPTASQHLVGQDAVKIESAQLLGILERAIPQRVH